MSVSNRRAVAAAFVVALLLMACGGGAPTAPANAPVTTPQPINVATITVGVAGNAPTTLAPGDKLQLFAQAAYSDGSTKDVTNVAVWQSSNPIAGTVSNTGLLTTAAEGAIDVSATYEAHSGSIHTEVQKPGCRVTLSPASLVFGAMANAASVTVTTTLSTCRWTARSDASWLSLSFDPGRSGSGSFSYNVPGNNNPDERDARIVVSVPGGTDGIHTVHQERPVSCVYQVSPQRLTFSAAGGNGSFDVTTQPGDCQWKITDTWSGIVLAATTGTGARSVTYTVAPGLSVGFDRTFRVQGLSGVNPPAIHTVRIDQ